MTNYLEYKYTTMDGTSLTPEQEKLNALRQILPEAFTGGKLDWEKLKATLGEDINFSNERYVLNWAGKSEVFKMLKLGESNFKQWQQIAGKDLSDRQAVQKL